MENIDAIDSDSNLPQPNQEILDLIERIDYAISVAYDPQQDPYEMRTKLHPWILSRMKSSIECKILLNELVKSDVNLLVIGCEKDLGGLLLSAINNSGYNSCFVVENFNKPYHSSDMEERFIINCKIMDADPNYSFKRFDRPQYGLTLDEKNQLKNINLLVYDGDRSIQDYEKLFTYYYENLTETFIVYVNNAYNQFTEEGIDRAIKLANLDKLHEVKLGFGSRKFEEDYYYWNNGTLIMVLKKRQS